MAGDDEPVRRRPGNRRAHVHQSERPDRRRVVPRLFSRLQPNRGKLGADVSPRLFDGGRAGRPRADRDQLPEVFPGAAGVEGDWGLRLQQEERQDEQRLHRYFR